MTSADYSKLDHWSAKAQQENYPARSVYKLKEMDEKFGLVKGGLKVLDLGAAPGSWSLYTLRKSPRASVVSVDLSPLSRSFDQGLFDKPEFVFIQGDFTSPEVREKILSRGPYKLILSDAAPATTGNRSVDTLRSLALAEIALDYATTALLEGGKLVVKVFQGGDSGALLESMRGLFESAKSFKPKSCRKGSFEVYYLGLGKIRD